MEKKIYLAYLNECISYKNQIFKELQKTLTDCKFTHQTQEIKCSTREHEIDYIKFKMHSLLPKTIHVDDKYLHRLSALCGDINLRINHKHRNLSNTYDARAHLYYYEVNNQNDKDFYHVVFLLDFDLHSTFLTTLQTFFIFNRFLDDTVPTSFYKFWCLINREQYEGTFTDDFSKVIKESCTTRFIDEPSEKLVTLVGSDGFGSKLFNFNKNNRIILDINYALVFGPLATISKTN